MTISHTGSSRTQILSSWSGKKVFVTFAILLGFLSSGSLYARELNSGNIADPAWGNCPITNNSCVMGGKGITSIASGTFAGYSNIQYLYFRDNQITSIESEDFVGLDNLQALSFRNNQITSIESGDFDGLSNLIYLYLDNNQITSIESGDFVGLDNLQTLSLRNNQITSIESGDFVGLDNLQTLSFPNNQITSIESEIFVGLDNLQNLDLGGNQITSIESGDFIGLDNLQTLNLYNNQITSIEPGDFNGLSNVLNLSLNNNQITSIESGDFAGLDNLQTLRLDSNQISSIESDDFAGLTNLQEFNLESNQITSIESGDFAGLDNLQDLDLGWNQITSIQSGTFQNLSNLQHLNLNNNQLSSIEPSDFSGLINLQEFNFESNQIISIDSGSFAGLSSLVSLRLAQNYLNIEDTAVTSYLNELSLNYIDYSNQYVFVSVHYTPNTITTGSVTGSLFFYGPTSYISTLQGDNPDMSIYDHLFTGNGTYLFDYSSMVDTNNYLGASAMGTNKTVLGTVNWIVPPAPILITPVPTDTPTPSGGGGGVILHKDECPQGDFTASYYDKSCGTNSMTGQTNTGKVTTDSTTTIQSNTITYKDTDIYNDTIANNYCYKRKADVSITIALQGDNSDEFHKALSVLYAYDLTAFNSVGKFKPNNLITREQAAKMFSNFAMNVLCIQGNTDLTVSYTDIQTADASLQHYITLAYQLGLMKGGVDGNFRPKDTITQAEVTAVLVRMLLKSYLPEQQGHTRYSEYNTVAKKLGILGQNAKDTTITRQDTSLMLFRAYKNQVFELQGGSYSIKNRESFLSL